LRSVSLRRGALIFRVRPSASFFFQCFLASCFPARSFLADGEGRISGVQDSGLRLVSMNLGSKSPDMQGPVSQMVKIIVSSRAVSTSLQRFSRRWRGSHIAGLRLRPSSRWYKPLVRDSRYSRSRVKMLKRLVVSSRDVSTSLQRFSRRWRGSHIGGLRLRPSSRWYKPLVRDSRYSRSRVKMLKRLVVSSRDVSTSLQRFSRRWRGSHIGGLRLRPSSRWYKPLVRDSRYSRSRVKMLKRLVVSSRDVSTSLQRFSRRWRGSHIGGLRLRPSSRLYKPLVRDSRYSRSRVKNVEEVCRFLSRRL
jgi:hypothetical protein